MIVLSCLGGALFALTIAGLSLHVPGALGIGSIALKTWFVGIAGISLAIYLLAVGLVTHRAFPARSIWIVLLVASALRLPLIGAPPFLSTDVYRYVWDGWVQAAGDNPYRYVPADPALAALRDDTVYPRINRADYAPTIYPPAAEAIFGIIGFLWPSVTGIKAAMVGFECVAVFCLWRMLAMAGLPAVRILIYAWNPLPVWDLAGNGHVDAAVIGLTAAALLLRAKQRDGWAGIALGLAVMVKFLPAVIAPVLWRPRAGWRTAIAATAVVVLSYAAYSSVGWRVFGFLQGYGTEEGYDDGSGFWLLAGLSRLIAIPPLAAPLYKTAVALVLVVLAVRIAFIRRPDDPVSLCAAAGTMMAVLTFSFSPHYPWYFTWLSLTCVLATKPAIVWLSSAPILMYLDTFGDRFVWPSVVFVPTLLLALVAIAARPFFLPIKGNA